MINIEKLEQYMSRSEIENFDTLADALGESRAKMQKYIATADMPLSVGQKIADLLAIPLEVWDEVFFAESAGSTDRTGSKDRLIEEMESYYSILAPDFNEDEILDSFQSLEWNSNLIDNLLAAWQFTESYPNDRPQYLQEAIDEVISAFPEDDYPEEHVANVEDAATMHGFALGVQFVLKAMKHNGQIMTMIRPLIRI